MGRFARRVQAASLKVQTGGVATAPLNVDAIAGDGEATVTWNVPASDGGSAITDYQVTVSPSTGVTGGAARLVGITTSVVFDGLTNGIEYTFVVRAVNEYGQGAASEASDAVTPSAPGALSTPSFTSIDVNGSTATHSFSTVAGATLYRIEIEKVG